MLNRSHVLVIHEGLCLVRTRLAEHESIDSDEGGCSLSEHESIDSDKGECSLSESLYWLSYDMPRMIHDILWLIYDMPRMIHEILWLAHEPLEA